MGPLTLRVQYSCIQQTFYVDLVAGFDDTVAVLFRNYEPDRNTFDDFDAEVLNKMTFEAKQLVRRWLK